MAQQFIWMKPRKRNDTAYPTVFTLKANTGKGATAITLAPGDVVKLIMRAEGGRVKVNGTCTHRDQTQFRGQVSYDWQAVDVDKAGNFRIELEVEYVGGKVATFPSGKVDPETGEVSEVYLMLPIVEDLEAA